MTNYVVEDGLNLWKIISADDTGTDTETDTGEKCLITNNNL